MAVAIVFNIVIIAYCAARGLALVRRVERLDADLPPVVAHGEHRLVPFTLSCARGSTMKRMWDAGHLRLAVAVFVMGLVKAYAMLNYSLDLYKWLRGRLAAAAHAVGGRGRRPPLLWPLRAARVRGRPPLGRVIIA